MKIFRSCCIINSKVLYEQNRRKIFKRIARKNGYSLRVFAEKIYASKSAVQRWEQTFIPETPEILNKIAEVLNLEVDEMRLESAVKYGKSNNKKEVVNITNDLVSNKATELNFDLKWLLFSIAIFLGGIFLFSFITLI